MQHNARCQRNNTSVIKWKYTYSNLMVSSVFKYIHEKATFNLVFKLNFQFQPKSGTKFYLFPLVKIFIKHKFKVSAYTKRYKFRRTWSFSNTHHFVSIHGSRAERKYDTKSIISFIVAKERRSLTLFTLISFWIVRQQASWTIKISCIFCSCACLLLSLFIWYKWNAIRADDC